MDPLFHGYADYASDHSQIDGTLDAPEEVLNFVASPIEALGTVCFRFGMIGKASSSLIAGVPSRCRKPCRP
jgi:hypothetical protein